MTDATANEPDIVSPCVGVCVMNHEVGYCYGCWRNRSEIANWLYASRDEKLGILRMIRQRRDSDASENGGRKRRRNRRRPS